MMKDFDIMFQSSRRVLKQRFPEDRLDRIYRESRDTYTGFLPKIPYIGGKENGQTKNLVGGVILLSIIRSLEAQDLPRREIGKIVYDTFVEFSHRTPRLIRWLMGKYMTSRFLMKKMRKSCRTSQLRNYPEDFVRAFLEGDGKTISCGMNYSECAICKFYQKQSAQEYLPYICLGDYPMFKAIGVGLIRSSTIGNGGEYCDFHFVRGGASPGGWPPEQLEEWNDTN